MFASIVAGPGIPALRHDWAWPSDRSGLFDFLTRSVSGWDPRGIGGPNLYINDYLISLAIAVLVFVFGAHGGLFVFMASIGAMCAIGGASVARRVGASDIGQAAVALIALFNPWVFAQTVAGHTYMILAYGALMALFAEYGRRSPRPVVASLFAILTLQQLQFFVVAVAVTGVDAIRARRWLPLASAVVTGAAAFAVIFLEYSAYRAVPYTLAWESSQSVDPARAVLLGGYYAGYTQRIDSIDRWVMLAVVGMCVYGFLLVGRTRFGVAIALSTAALVILASGLSGPLAGVERFAISTLPESHLFRELYDILGLVAIGYCAGVGVASRRAAGGFAALAAGVALAVAWFVWSPWQWWVATTELPHADVHAAPYTRYALLPAFQPLSRLPDNAGSGPDPDARILPDGVVPINSLLPGYPADAALAAFENRGDARPLAALGVSEIVSRPWLTSDSSALSAQRALPAPRTAASAAAAVGTLALIPSSALVLERIPPTCSVCADLSAGAVFFGDVAGMSGPLVPSAWRSYSQAIDVRPPSTSVLAKDGWVDARLAFASDPELAQAFGGAVTTSHDAMLPVLGGLDALVFVRGRLLASSGALIAKNTSGYAWVEFGDDVHALRCDGLCAVALEARGAKAIPAETPSSALSSPLSIRAWIPWMASADIPPGRAAMLRYDVAYDKGWTASMRGSILPHVRVDAFANGWLVPERGLSETVTIVHVPSLVAAILEAIGLAWAGWLVVALCLQLSRRHDQAAREGRANAE